MAERVLDQVVERLTQPLAIAVDRKAVVRLGGNGTPRERRRLGSVARELRRVDALDAHRCRGGIREEALDALRARRAASSSSRRLRPASAAGYASAMATRAATGLRISCARTASRPGTPPPLTRHAL